MNLLERVLTLLRANLDSVVEKSDDPEKILRQLQLDMRNQLVQVKTQVATAIAEGHRLQKRSQERKAEADTWLERAKQAVEQGNDDRARAALTRYNDINKQVKRYLQQKKDQDQLVVTMRSALRQLEAKIAEVETTIDLLATRKRNALIQQRVFDALGKSGGSRDKERASKAQDAVSEAEARARALAELHRRDVDVQLDQLTEQQEIEQKLQELKNRQLSTQPPLLHEGQPHTSPLVPPQPRSSAPARRRAVEASRQTGDLDATVEPAPAEDIDLEYLKKLLDMPQNS